jgi:hypothetical protein
MQAAVRAAQSGADAIDQAIRPAKHCRVSPELRRFRELSVNRFGIRFLDWRYFPRHWRIDLDPVHPVVRLLPPDLAHGQVARRLRWRKPPHGVPLRIDA